MMNDDRELSQSIAELIRLHDDVLARVFALQAVLQDLSLCSASEVQERTDQFRKKFGGDLEARFVALQPAVSGRCRRKSSVTA